VTTHDRVRELASARHDGELDPALRPELDTHIATCTECQAFADRLAALAAAVALVPRTPTPVRLTARVEQANRPRPARRWSWVLAPAVTAVALVVMLVVTNGAGPAGFPLPAAGAATPLLELRSVYVVREVETVRTTLDSHREVETTREQIWFDAPGLLRIERTTTTATGRTEDLLIERPGARFTTQERLVTGLPPFIVLPEPLSPTIAELGRDIGPGPRVAGRATRRIELAAGGETRVALVDADRPYVLGSEQTVVLGKSPDHPESGPFTESVTKRVVSVDLSADNDPARFDLPDVPATDARFRELPVDDLVAGPAELPRGFDVVRSGRGPWGDALLLTRGALPVLIEITAVSPTEDLPNSTQRVMVAGRPAELQVFLYGAPRVSLEVGDRVVTISAPLPTASLVDLAAHLYPSE
jgi:hypothetical protein